MAVHYTKIFLKLNFQREREQKIWTLAYFVPILDSYLFKKLLFTWLFVLFSYYQKFNDLHLKTIVLFIVTNISFNLKQCDSRQPKLQSQAVFMNFGCITPHNFTFHQIIQWHKLCLHWKHYKSNKLFSIYNF